MSTIQVNRQCTKEVTKRGQAELSGWRRVTGVICDRRIPSKVEGKINKMVWRPAIVYGLETVTLTKRREAEM